MKEEIKKILARKRSKTTHGMNFLGNLTSGNTEEVQSTETEQEAELEARERAELEELEARELVELEAKEKIDTIIRDLKLEDIIPEEFDALTEAEQLKVLQDLKQRIVDLVKTEAQTQYSEKLQKEAQEALSSQTQEELSKWGKITGKVKSLPGIAYRGIKRNAIKARDLANLENKIFTELKTSETNKLKEVVKRDLELLTKKIQKKENEINLDGNGNPIIAYISLNEDVNKEQKAIIEDFNRIANAFTKIPYEWGLEKKGKLGSPNRKKYDEAKKAYEEVRNKVIEEIINEKDLYKIIQIDNAIKTEQLLNTHPEFEQTLANFEETTEYKSWYKRLFTYSKENKDYLALSVTGGVIRWGTRGLVGTTGTLAFLAAPILGGSIGYFRGKLRGEKNLLEKQKGERTEKEGTKIEKNSKQERSGVAMVDTKHLTTNLQKLIENINNESSLENRDNKKQRTLVRLKLHIDHIRGKIERGEVNFGKKEDALANQFNLINLLNEAIVLQEVNKKNIDEEIQTKANSLIQKIGEKVGEKTEEKQKEFIKKQAMRGAMMGAGFATAGYVFRWFGEQMGWWEDTDGDVESSETSTEEVKERIKKRIIDRIKKRTIKTSGLTESQYNIREQLLKRPEKVSIGVAYAAEADSSSAEPTIEQLEEELKNTETTETEKNTIRDMIAEAKLKNWKTADLLGDVSKSGSDAEAVHKYIYRLNAEADGGIQNQFNNIIDGKLNAKSFASLTERIKFLQELKEKHLEALGKQASYGDMVKEKIAGLDSPRERLEELFYNAIRRQEELLAPPQITGEWTTTNLLGEVRMDPNNINDAGRVHNYIYDSDAKLNPDIQNKFNAIINQKFLKLSRAITLEEKIKFLQDLKKQQTEALGGQAKFGNWVNDAIRGKSPTERLEELFYNAIKKVKNGGELEPQSETSAPASASTGGTESATESPERTAGVTKPITSAPAPSKIREFYEDLKPHGNVENLNETYPAHKISSPMSFTLGQGKTPASLERVFSGIVASYVPLPENGVINNEYATKVLNMAANLRELEQQRYDVANVAYKDFEEAVSFENGKLEIKDADKFNKILEKLYTRAEDNWNSGKLKGNGAAINYIRSINEDTWLKIATGEVVEKTDAEELTELGHKPDVVTTTPKLETPKAEINKLQEEVEKLKTEQVSITKELEEAKKENISQKIEEITKTLKENERRIEELTKTIEQEIVQMPEKSRLIITYRELFGKDALEAFSEDKVVEIIKIYRDNIFAIFNSNEHSLEEWSNLQQTNATEFLTKHSQDTIPHPLSNYLAKLEKITGLKPIKGDAINQPESIEKFIARALKKATELGKLEEVKISK